MNVEMETCEEEKCRNMRADLYKMKCVSKRRGMERKKVWWIDG